MLHRNTREPLQCNWPDLRSHIIQNWHNISAKELDKVGPDRENIAFLLVKKYGWPRTRAENYLRNVERTLPSSSQ